MGMGLILFVFTLIGCGTDWFNYIFGTLSAFIEVSPLNIIEHSVYLGATWRATILAQLFERTYHRPGDLADWHVVLR